jgi:sulfur carrier protein
LQILVNGEAVVTAARTLAELCADLGFGEAKIATALNGTFVAPAERERTTRAPQAEDVIVAPRQGG